MQDLSLHILDLAENAIRAKAKKISIGIRENKTKKHLSITVRDDGRGMSLATAKKAVSPFFTTKKGKKIGLGLALFEQAALQTGGKAQIRSLQGKGTEVNGLFHTSHPDMKPLGNILETLACLVAGNPAIQFIYRFSGGKNKYYFNSGKSGTLKNSKITEHGAGKRKTIDDRIHYKRQNVKD